MRLIVTYITGRHMKRIEKYRYPLMMLLFAGVSLLLAACSDEQEPDGRQRVPVELGVYMPSFVDESPTRAAFPPAGYVDYQTIYGSSGMFRYQANNVGATIGVFFKPAAEVEPTEGVFTLGVDNKWRANFQIATGKNYVYGFIPVEDVAPGLTNVEISSADYSDGATIKLKGLSTITPSDVCVIVAAARGTSETEVGDGFAVGNFEYVAEGSGGANNYVFLLFDHLYSGLRFRFSIDSDYNKLRTIKLKELRLVGYDGSTIVKDKMDVTVEMKKGASPIKNVSFAPTTGAADLTEGALLYNDGPFTLTTTPSDFIGCFAPAVSQFKLVSIYDVYDKKENLVRKDCKAENRINIFEIFGKKPERGRLFTLNLTVKPTYLYVLSDPDVDNPTISISN